MFRRSPRSISIFNAVPEIQKTARPGAVHFVSRIGRCRTFKIHYTSRQDGCPLRSHLHCIASLSQSRLCQVTKTAVTSSAGVHHPVLGRDCTRTPQARLVSSIASVPTLRRPVRHKRQPGPEVYFNKLAADLSLHVNAIIGPPRPACQLVSHVINVFMP